MIDVRQKLEVLAQSRSAPETELDAQGVAEIVGADLEAMLSFYRALGFRIERRTGAFAVLNGFGMRIFVAESADAPNCNRWVNLRIIVPDVDMVWACVNMIGLVSSSQAAIRDSDLAYVLPNGGEFEQCWPVLRKYFGKVRPAAMMICAGLADPRMKIEIEVTALKRS